MCVVWCVCVCGEVLGVWVRRKAIAVEHTGAIKSFRVIAIFSRPEETRRFVAEMISGCSHASVDAGHRLASARERHYFYNLYGFCLKSEWPLPHAELPNAPPPAIELFRGPDDSFENAARQAGRPLTSDAFFQHDVLSDGSSYFRRPGMYEFIISPDGRRIAARAAELCAEPFHAYALSGALSFSILRHGLDPFHATAVVIGNEAVAFLGESGLGKSTLAASFVTAGWPILTDDLLVLREREGLYYAEPGLPRLKLFPEMNSAVLGAKSTGVAMNPLTRKRIFPLKPEQHHSAPVRLRAIYSLKAHRSRISIRCLHRRDIVVYLHQNAFNTALVEPDVLRRRFGICVSIAYRIPVKQLSYPRQMDMLPSVRQRILLDIASIDGSGGREYALD